MRNKRVKVSKSCAKPLRTLGNLWKNCKSNCSLLFHPSSQLLGYFLFVFACTFCFALLQLSPCNCKIILSSSQKQEGSKYKCGGGNRSRGIAISEFLFLLRFASFPHCFICLWLKCGRDKCSLIAYLRFQSPQPFNLFKLENVLNLDKITCRANGNFTNARC